MEDNKLNKRPSGFDMDYECASLLNQNIGNLTSKVKILASNF
jgi:hypothetical protein